MAYSTVDEEFNEQAYAGAGLQPSVGERATMAFDKTRQLRNNTTRVTGVAMRKGGKAIQRSGTKMMRAGAAMSRSGIGAVAGVPLMAAGAAVRGAGALNQNTGRSLTNQAQGTKKLLRAKGLIGDKKSIKKRVAATRTNLTVLSVATPIWFTIQLPLALVAMFALGVTGLGEGVADQIMGGAIGGVIYGVYDTITNGVEYATGINLNMLENWTQFGQVVFGSLTTLVFLIGMITLLVMAGMYIMSGVHCFFGEHSGAKIATFIIALLFYLVPVLNILPWFMLWGIVVWCYPK
jgi:hypothetical protein